MAKQDMCLLSGCGQVMVKINNNALSMYKPRQQFAQIHFVYSGIDRLQIDQKGLHVFVGHIFAGIAQLVDNAVLDFSLWKGGVDGRIKSRQIVSTGHENTRTPLPHISNDRYLCVSNANLCPSIFVKFRNSHICSRIELA